jgi:hypothetical protein
LAESIVMQKRRSAGFLGVILLALLPMARAAAADPSYQPGMDLPSFDYRNFDLPRPRPRFCQEACLADQRCKAWTFVRMGTLGPLASCWLKSQVPEARPDPCCVSGVR